MTDQGHGYELRGIVAGLDVLARLARVHPSAGAVPLDVEGLGLMPVTDGLAAVTPAALCELMPLELDGGPASTGRPGGDLLTGPESGFEHLTAGLLALVEAGSALTPVAYLEADYLGRDGRQAAAVWSSGVTVLGPFLLGRDEPFPAGTAPISLALRRLGVTARGRRDEFVVAGLGRHRRTSGWGTGG